MVSLAVGALVLVDGPLAVTVWSPEVLEGTEKLAVQFPCASALIAVATEVESNLMEIPLSLARNAVPEALIVDPGAVVVWSRIRRALTSKVLWPVPGDDPDARIVLGPPDTSGICTVPKRFPLASA